MESVSAATTVVTDENTRYEQIIKNIQLALFKLKRSFFFEEFMKQMRDPEIVAQIERVTEHSKLQVVLYGIGELEPTKHEREAEVSHLQLAFVILLKERFEWVNDIVVYDPCLSPLEQKAISAFDCTFLAVNEFGRRTVDRPTLFFLPHCPALLVNNILSANWTTANLNKIIVLGNSFSEIKDDLSRGCKVLTYFKHLMAILHSDKMVTEIQLPQPQTEIERVRDYREAKLRDKMIKMSQILLPQPEIERVRDDPEAEILAQQYESGLYKRPGVYRTAFSEMSWHFFPYNRSLEDLNLNLFPESIPNNRRHDLMFLRGK